MYQNKFKQLEVALASKPVATKPVLTVRSHLTSSSVELSGWPSILWMCLPEHIYSVQPADDHFEFHVWFRSAGVQWSSLQPTVRRSEGWGSRTGSLNRSVIWAIRHNPPLPSQFTPQSSPMAMTTKVQASYGSLSNRPPRGESISRSSGVSYTSVGKSITCWWYFASYLS